MPRLYVIPTRFDCPANCPFCITKQQFNPTSSNEKEFIDVDVFKNDWIIKNMNAINLDMVEITGGGEPLIHDNIFDIIRYFNKAEKKIKLYTNGFISKITNKIKWSDTGCADGVYVDELTLSKMSLNNAENDKLQRHNESFKSNLIGELSVLRKFCKKIRLRIYISDLQNKQIELLTFNEMREYLTSINGLELLFRPEFYKNIDSIVFSNDINKQYTLSDTFLKVAKSTFHTIKTIKIDNNEKNCPEYPILYTDGELRQNWKNIMKPNKFKNYLNVKSGIGGGLYSNSFKSGYHVEPIKKGILGESSKILEEVNELIESEKQNNKIMSMVELSDIYGALESYLLKNFNGLSMEDLKIMSDATKRAFKNGHRK